MDHEEMSQLRQLVPTPEAGTVFVPLSMKDEPAHTGIVLFDYFAVPALGTPWSAEAVVRQACRRSDLTSMSFRWWAGQPSLCDVDAAGFRNELMGPRITWSRAVPFTIDRQGVVRLVDTITIALPGGRQVDVPLPHVRRLTGPRGLSEFPFRLDSRG
jgi:hypothetical protein